MVSPILSTLDRGRRIVATGFAFAAFGIGAVIISTTWFPVIRLLSKDDAETRRRIRRALRSCFALFIASLRGLGLLTLEVRGADKLHVDGHLIIANHPTLIDVVLLGSLIPHADCIVKQQLWRNPFLRWPVRWADYIPNSEPEALLTACTERLKAGRSLMVFPEGTRSEPGSPPQFKRGAAQVALAAQCPILPVRLTCDPPTLRKREPWFRVPPRKPHFTVIVGEPIEASSYAKIGEPTGIAARRVTQLFEDVLLRASP